MELSKKANCTERVSATLFVPQPRPELYRLTDDYCPVNAATIKNTSPLPHVDAVLQNERDAQAFAVTDFTSRY